MFGFLRKKAAPVVAETSEITLTRQEHGVYEVTVHGIIDESQFRALQVEGAHEIEKYGAIKLLCDMRDMQGWRTPPKGDNLEFLLTYDAQIKKIAIVGDADKKDAALMFSGAGYRKAEVRFFVSAAMDQARQWVAE
jgi:hypothetical protein